MLTRILLPLALLLVLALLRPAPAIAPLDGERDLATLVPERALVFAEAPALSATLELGFEQPLVKALLASEAGALLARATGKSPQELLGQLDRRTGVEVLPTVAALGARGLALALAFDREKPTFLLLARGDDAVEQRRAIEHLLDVVANKFGFPGAFAEPADLIADADVWYVGNELGIASRDALLLASNDKALLRDALELAAAAESRGLTGIDAFANAAHARAPHHFVWAWADLDRLEQVAKGGGLKKLRAMLSDPAAQMLLGPGVSALGSGGALTFSVDLEREDVRVELRASAIELGAAGVLMPSTEARVIALAPRASDVASAVIHRDFADAFEHRVALFPAAKLPGFAKASSDLALFFGGRDFSEEVLPHVSPWMRVVARPVAFDAGATPEIPLPAAAAVFELDDPEQLGPVLMSAFQTAVGLINVKRAQEALESMVMELALVDGVSMTTARFLAPREGDGVDLRYNLEPACAIVGRALVVGTHERLVAELVRELRDAPTAFAASEQLRLTGRSLAEIVRANFAALSARAVLEEGKPREQAEGELEGLIALLGLVECAEVAVEYASPREVRLVIALDVVAAGN